MEKLNKQAEELNKIIKENSPTTYNLLSKKGKAAFFPKKGIISQSTQAKEARINATIGEAVEDDGTPVRLSSIAKKVLLDLKKVLPYASSFGEQELRKRWEKELRRKNPSLKSGISFPVVTNGLTHALNIVGYLFIDPGDKIITADKYWENYSLIFESSFAGVLETYNTFKGTGFDIESFKKKLERKEGKKTVLLNFPNNPTGYTPTNKEVVEIVRIIKDRAQKGDEVLVICDDAYFGLVYEKGVFKESIFAKLANLHENIFAIKIDGVSKELYAWGLRVGFITYGSRRVTQEAYNALEAKTAGVIRASVSNVSHLSQTLCLEALNSRLFESEKSATPQAV